MGGFTASSGIDDSVAQGYEGPDSNSRLRRLMTEHTSKKSDGFIRGREEMIPFRPDHTMTDTLDADCI